MFSERTKLKSIKYICEKCGKPFVEKQIDFKHTMSDGSTIENEFIPVCQACFKKVLKKQKKIAWLHEKLSAGLLSADELSLYASGKISEEKLNQLIRSRKDSPLPVMTKEDLVKKVQESTEQFI